MNVPVMPLVTVMRGVTTNGAITAVNANQDSWAMVGNVMMWMNAPNLPWCVILIQRARTNGDRLCVNATPGMKGQDVLRAEGALT